MPLTDFDDPACDLASGKTEAARAAQRRAKEARRYVKQAERRLCELKRRAKEEREAGRTEHLHEIRVAASPAWGAMVRATKSLNISYRGVYRRLANGLLIVDQDGEIVPSAELPESIEALTPEGSPDAE